MNKHIFLSVIILIPLTFGCRPPEELNKKEKLQISGVYPHLAVFGVRDTTICGGSGHETGIGAVVPWSDKLWMITYSPHCPRGSSDKLYSIDRDLNLTIHPESIGGTPANRFIHRETNQLLIGPYLIDTTENIRTIPYSRMPGRLTATSRHLEEPANRVYYFDMEGAIYEANVNTLEVNLLFRKPVPGWHGKGAYTGQGRYIITNNGEHKVFDIENGLLKAGGPPRDEDDMGTLAEWDGEEWRIVERKQFTDVTGPGGIYGAENPDDPVWSIGWDRRSVLLNVLDQGKWYTYRLPKSTHTYDHWGGWYTEWPRIREVTGGKWLMDMHGMFYDFPPSFSRENTAGIVPVCNHLRYIPDFTAWNGRIVLATDETSLMGNPYAGRAQSNLWFGQWEDLKEWGPPNGWGGVWVDDRVNADKPSEPFLVNGFRNKILHLAHQASQPVKFILEVDPEGTNNWEKYREITVPATGYTNFILPDEFSAHWIRLSVNRTCRATAFFHFNNPDLYPGGGNELFDALANIEEEKSASSGLIRPAEHNKNLQFINLPEAGEAYFEINQDLRFSQPDENRKREVLDILKLEKHFILDDASVIVKDNTGTYRLPKTSPEYDQPFEQGWPRDIREVESERYMYNVHGTFYEFPREAGLSAIRPIATHKKRILDFCTWSGLLVISGTSADAREDGHYFESNNGEAGLWFGAIDDIWKMGKPVGEGGVWKNTQVIAGEPSLPYLMTGYDHKTLEITSSEETTFDVQINFDHNGWYNYLTIEVPAGETVVHEFPDKFSAHWVRLIARNNTTVTAWFVYE